MRKKDGTKIIRIECSEHIPRNIIKVLLRAVTSMFERHGKRIEQNDSEAALVQFNGKFAATLNTHFEQDKLGMKSNGYIVHVFLIIKKTIRITPKHIVKPIMKTLEANLIVTPSSEMTASFA